MAQLKAVVFSLRNVFFDDTGRKLNEEQIELLVNFINHLVQMKIRVILHSNDRWTIKNSTTTIAQYIGQRTKQSISYYNKFDYPAMPRKPRADAIPFILKHENLEANEIIYVGCNETDWLSCINAKILFVKANWIKSSEEIRYGVSFDDMAALARFIDICCIQANESEIIKYVNDHIEFYTLSPFSTYKPTFQQYSASARSTAKQISESAEPDFWLMLLIAKIYFSGLYAEINTVVTFPGHQPGYGNPIMDEALNTLTNCFKSTYLHDALVRHTASIKSQSARKSGQGNILGIYNHLNSLKVNPNPRKFGSCKPYKSNIYKNKTILLIDDFATAGYSLDAASLLLKKAGAKRVICFSWLKTINTSLYVSTNSLPAHYPAFEIVTNSQDIFTHPKTIEIDYHSIIPSSLDGEKMKVLFSNFLQWDKTEYNLYIPEK